MDNLLWTHLGDGVYGAFDGYHVVLRVNDPRDEDEPTIYLDTYTANALIEYVATLSDYLND